nr:unnamed protein product [Digitaria exilis]
MSAASMAFTKCRESSSVNASSRVALYDGGVRGWKTERSWFGRCDAGSVPSERVNSDHAVTSELNAHPSRRTWLVRHATVKPPHAKDTT